MRSVMLRSLLAFCSTGVSLPAVAAPDFAACFTLTPGLSWSNGEETVVHSTDSFAGRDVISVTASGAGFPRATFHDRSGRQLLGEVEYNFPSLGNGNNDAPASIDVYISAPSFPPNATPGERFMLAGRGERTVPAEGTVSPIKYDGAADYTFMGFETLTVNIGDTLRTFKDTCHLSARIEGGRVEAWYAAGFGRIKYQQYRGNELLMQDQITAINE